MKKISKYLLLIFLLLTASLNFNFFLKPLKLVTGGTQGLAIVLSDITKLSHSSLILIINLLMLILGFLFLSKKTTFGTLLATISYPLFVKLTSHLQFSFPSIYLNILVTGIISGLTNGFIYKLGFTAGGVNTLGPILKKHWDIPVGTINLFVNMIILFLGCFHFGLKKCIYSILVIIINSLVINLVLYKRFMKTR